MLTYHSQLNHHHQLHLTPSVHSIPFIFITCTCSIIMKNIIFSLFFIYSIVVYSKVYCQSQQIPKYLEECYLNETFHRPKLPLTLPIFIDILQKIETFSHDTMDLRSFTSSILHRFKFDGIQFHKNINFKPGILPFGGTGSQRTKNQLINTLIPGNAQIFPNHSLSLLERCTLHRILSNTIGEADSPQTDPLCAKKPTEKISENIQETKLCPTEQGVISTKFQTITPGSIIAAIAAALQHQNVPIKFLSIALNSSRISSDIKVDNVWLATIAGELAELVVYQGPLVGSDMIFGSAGFWNTTIRPQIYYLIEANDNFDITRAEIIGAIDGFIIAKYLKSWLTLFNNLRLSQILEMYYSSKGFFTDSVGACKRKYIFWTIVSKTILEEQIYAASQLLTHKKSVAYMTNEALKEITTYAIQKFTNYVNSRLFSHSNCPEDQTSPRAEIFVTFDGAWSKEYTADFFAVLLEDLNVSKFGSKIAFLHGTTAEWLLNITDSPSNVHETFISQLKDISWPTYLNFTKNFQQIEESLTKKWTNKQRNHSIGSLSQVVIFFASQGMAKSHNNELNQTIFSIKNFKDKHPDVNLLYYVTEEHSSSFKPFLISQEDQLIDDTLKFNHISQKLLHIPKSIRPALCNPNITHGIRDQVEDYIKPQEIILYRLDPKWRIQTKQVIITVSSFAYGSLEICSWSQMRNNGRKDHFRCTELSGHSEVNLIDFFDCKKGIHCPAVFYQFRGIISQRKCAEIDCKSPDYIRFLLRLENLQCSDAATFILTHSLIIFSLYLSLYNV